MSINSHLARSDFASVNFSSRFSLLSYFQEISLPPVKEKFSIKYFPFGSLNVPIALTWFRLITGNCVSISAVKIIILFLLIINSRI